MLHVLDALLGSWLHPFSFLFIWVISLNLSSDSVIFSLAVLNLWLSPRKAFFILVTMFLTISLSLDYFLLVSFSDKVTHLFLHAAHLFHETFNTWITAVLRLPCDNANFCVVWIWFVGLVSWGHFFSLFLWTPPIFAESWSSCVGQ